MISTTRQRRSALRFHLRSDSETVKSFDGLMA
jgi:hypothetical protein